MKNISYAPKRRIEKLYQSAEHGTLALCSDGSLFQLLQESAPDAPFGWEFVWRAVPEIPQPASPTPVVLPYRAPDAPRSLYDVDTGVVGLADATADLSTDEEDAA